ncbi:molybdopterin-dependent oxidoreductase [Rugosimonospora acidiphila]|uniref:molybdopterin-dependent oxidoreductase n=1 Tax=Rugosimonospora acidiphila TaxID=556531 RepID=UPI0031EE07E2
MRSTTSRSRRLAVLAAAVFTAVALTAGTASGASSGAPNIDRRTGGGAAAKQRTVLLVDGAVRHRVRLSATDLAALPEQTVTVTFESGTGTQTHTYTGPLLLDVLNRAQPKFDPTVKNDQLRYVVTATGSDRYQATVAWGEFDPGFEHKSVLVAVTEDGQPTADGLARLVVPGDVKGGRYVSDLIRLRLHR